MSRSKHQRHQPPQLTPAQQALAYTDGDLADLERKWHTALEQLDLANDPPPRLREAPTPERVAAREERDKAEKLDKIRNAQQGRVPIAGASPAPLRVAALEDLVIAEAGLLALGDKVTTHVRRNPADQRLGPHRLRAHRPTPKAPPRRDDRDDLGYPLHFGYGRYRSYAGRLVDAVGDRRDRDPGLGAIRWLRAALPAITDVDLAETVAAEVQRIRRLIRGVAGFPDMQIRISPVCFVCGQPSLRLNIDSEYVECRNADCAPSEEQCSNTGPRGEPRWYKAEWDWLKARLRDELDYPLNLGYGRSFDDEVRAVLEIAS